MTILNGIEIKNFRGIKELNLKEFNQFNLIVGNNDVGKTAILEALYLSINPNNAQLPLNINAFRGITVVDNQFWKSLFLNYNVDNPIEINTTLFGKDSLQVKTQPIIEINESLKVVQENITVPEASSGTNVNQQVNGLKINFSYRKKGHDDATNTYSSEVKFIPSNLAQGQSPFKFTPNGNWKSIMDGFYLATQNTYGDDLTDRISKISASNMEDNLVSIAQEIQPRVRKIDIDSKRRVRVELQDLPEKILINSLGEGVYTTVNILSLIYSASNGVVLLDEVERGLDRTSQKIVWRAIFRTAKKFNVQVFATTHSMEMIQNFNKIALEEKMAHDIGLTRIEIVDSKHKATQIPQEKLQVFIKENIEVR